ncbi:amidohydrolase [Roseovarius faecimaris]|uniref:Amidohydrolase n=1 Tax=Roseovarius faecimaris TaxID=2494550 RepID=A0A6I6IPH0_9RHOB|nr:amidohydrolase [Roseovarius faecimaris]QGX97106.1 amidohydrolase [Roseovarius faecimaris]
MKTAPLKDQMTAWRHALHRRPELQLDVPQTAGFVAERLREFGLEVHEGVGRSGVVGVLTRGNGTRSIGLRAELDALPITEANGFAHRSEHPGKMHACGHDGHMTMLLGAAKYLSEQGDFNGRVQFIFQPDEEFGTGAQAMLNDGLTERFEMDEVYAIHNLPGMEAGAFATRVGPITASESLFEIRVTGQGGHAALPHMGVDAITVGAELVGALQTIVSRKLDPAQNGVVSVTEFVTDGRRNVLPGQATLSGDARALTPKTNTAIEAGMRQIAEGIAQAHGVTAHVSYETIFDPTINAAAPVRAVEQAARQITDAVDADCPPKLFSEDFAHMAAAVPGAFILMGNGTTGAHARPLHSADYDFNDATLVPGSSFWVALVEQQLRV